MLAKSVKEVPDPAAVRGGMAFEPKWDGFRGIIYFDGSDIEIGSRGSKPLTRYFPELVATFREQLAGPCVLDGEIIVRAGTRGGEHLDWEALSQRIHPAASRIERLSTETPAAFVAFDLLAEGAESLLGLPFRERRKRLEQALKDVRAPVHLSRQTFDMATAERWLEQFEGAGLDGVMAKPLEAVYSPGKRIMQKVKHARTADVVVTGYRVHKSGRGVGSLLLGLYDGELLRSVGGASAFSDKRRLELIDELEPLVQRGVSGEAITGEGERSRFSGAKDTTFVRLRPELVAEVAYDQMEGSRFRHTAQFVRWRPDREPNSCVFEQLERPTAYDLEEVLG